jgi:hypothetical protein
VPVSITHVTMFWVSWTEEITDYDQENARTARAALTILKEEYPALVGWFADENFPDKGTSIRPPCRF